MATPLTNVTEWSGSSTDGPAATSVIARTLEKFTVMRFASSAARASAFTTAGFAAVKGMVCCLDDDAEALYKYNGSTWTRFLPTSPVDRGAVSLTFAASVNSNSTPVTFSTTFSSAPIVVTQVGSGAGTAIGITLRITNVSTSGFTLLGTAPSAITGTFSIHWIAQG